MDLNHGIIFKSLWQGSLVGRSDAQLVFIFLVSNADPDECVDVHPSVISALTGMPIERVRAALDYLESPDSESRNPDNEGRRISRLDDNRDWGWKVHNRPVYKELFQKEKRRRNNRDLKRRQRHPLSPDVTTASPAVTECLPQSPQAVGSRQEAVGSKESTPLAQSAVADFAVVWAEYPHYGTRSRKAEALRVWKRLTPKPVLAEVLAGIARCRAADDWTRESGQFVPGMQVWVRQRGWESSNGSAPEPEDTWARYRT